MTHSPWHFSYELFNQSCLQDFSTTQRSIKGDFDSFDSELSQQRKTLYLELGLIKDAQTALRNTCNMLEKKYIAESSTLDNRFLDLDSALRSLKAIVKAENEGGVEGRANSEFSKEVITALVTEVILADTVERRNREAVEAAQAISSKQSGEAAALGELSEIRITAQLQGLKKEFAAEIAQMSSRLLQQEAELLEVGRRNATEAESWRVVMDNRVLELHAQATVQAASHMEIVQQLQADIDKKTCDLASAMEAMKTSNEKHLLASTQSVDKVEVNPVAESLSELQREVKRLTEKVEMMQKVVAEVSTVSIHMGEELTSTRSIANNNHDTISTLSVTVMKLNGVMGVKSAPDESVTLQSKKLVDQIKKLEDRLAVVAATGLANKQEGDKNIERRALTISNQLSKLSIVVDVLQSSFLKAEQSYSSAMSKSTSSIERYRCIAITLNHYELTARTLDSYEVSY